MNQTNKTTTTKPSDISREWFVIDASDKILGRLAVKVAEKLMGKSKVLKSSNLDSGDYVIVINASEVKVTGNKRLAKTYFRHSGFSGGAKVKPFEDMIESNPEYVLRKAVKNMLPKNKLGSAMYTKLFVYADDKHPHEAQKPKILDI